MNVSIQCEKNKKTIPAKVEMQMKMKLFLKKPEDNNRSRK